MKKLFTAALLILTGLMNLFPAHSTNNARAESTPAAQAAVHAGSGLAVTREWKMDLYGSSIGATGLFAQDLDGDGRIEILAGAKSSFNLNQDDYWYVLRYSGSNTYKQVWLNEKYSTPIQRIAVADVNSDGIAEIFIGLADASVRVYRGTDFNQTDQFTVKYPIWSMLLADVDGNGSKELVFSNGADAAVYNPSTHELLWDLKGTGGYAAVGNVNGDASKEIVLSNGYVFNGVTRALEWRYETGFGSGIALGDTDGDGMEEIAGSFGWARITIFDADLMSISWVITTDDYYTVGLAVTDVNGDKRPEILYGDDVFGAIHCVNGQTHQEVLQIKNPDIGVMGLLVADVDQDQSLEMLWGAGYAGVGSPEYLFVASLPSGIIEWHNDDVRGPFSAVDTGDVDDDGQPEIVAATYLTGMNDVDCVIEILDANTHKVEWKGSIDPTLSVMENVKSIRIADVDQDGQTEFVIAANQNNSGLIKIYNGRSHLLERQSSGYPFAYFQSLEIKDVDGDGKTEIVVAEEAHIDVFNGATAEEEWRSITLGSSGDANDVDLKDVDGDGRIEIIVSIKGDGVYVFDAVTHVMQIRIPGQAYSIFTADVDQDGTQSILVGRDDGKVESYNGKTYELESTISLGSGPVTCLSWVDLDQNAVPEWLVCDSSKVSIYSTGDDSLLWQSGDFGKHYLAKYNQAPVAQIDADDDLEILVGGDDNLYQFDVPWVGPLGLSHMTVSQKSAIPGDVLTYTLFVAKNGHFNLPLVQVDNPLPTDMNYVTGTLSASSGIASYADGKITWNGSLEVQNPVTISYQAAIQQGVQRGRTLINQAKIIGDGQIWTISAGFFMTHAYQYVPLCFKDYCGNYYDSFASVSSGWPVGEDGYKKTEYAGGEYRVLGKNTNYIYTIKAPTCKRENYYVQVDAHWATNSTGAYYGLVFGLTDDFSKYYLFMVNVDYRAYYLYYHGPSGFEGITSRESSYIKTGSAVNQIGIARDGDKIAMYINGNLLEEWTDSRISGRTRVGLLNVPYSDLPNADSRFDNFRVDLIEDSTSGSANALNVTPAATPGASDQSSTAQPFPDGLLKPEN